MPLMEKPFDLELLNLLVARAIADAVRLQRVEGATRADSEGIAAFALLGSKHLKSAACEKKVHIAAGFRLAMLICRRLLADPLHGHRGGIKRDIAGVQRWLLDQQGHNGP